MARYESDDRDAEGANRARVGVEGGITRGGLTGEARSRVATAVDSAIVETGIFEGRDGMKPGFTGMTSVPARPSEDKLAELGKGYFARPGVGIPTDAAPNARY